jgi:hypothetical protein
MVRPRRLLIGLLAWLTPALAHADAKSFAFADLSNTAYSGRTAASRLGDVVSVKDYGAVGDGATDDCSAFTQALATGRTVRVPQGTTAAYRIGCQLTIAHDGQELVCESKSPPIALYYASGPQIVIGGASQQTNNIAVRNCTLISMQAGQPMFFVRWVRGFRVYDARAVADQFLRLGDSGLATSQKASIAELYRSELSQMAGATMHFVNLENFGGQWIADHVFFTGSSTPGLDGWRCTDNIQPRVDDVEWDEGYWSRSDNNISATDCRITNVKIIGLQSEGALSNAIHLEITGSTAKPAGDVGFEAIQIIGGLYDGAGEAIQVKSARAGTQMARLQIDHIQNEGAAATGGAIRIEASAGLVEQVTLDDIRGWTAAATATTDWITIKGSDSANTIDGVLIDNIGGTSTNGTPLRSQVRTEGSMNTDVRAGYNVLAGGAGERYSDPSGVLSHP